jgi:nitrogen-specific signal transduction histidine kinase
MDDITYDGIQEAYVIDDGRLHEIRNRFTVVKGVAQLLDRQVLRDDWQRDKIIDRVDRLQNEITQLEHLLDNLDTDGPFDRTVIQDQPH